MSLAKVEEPSSENEVYDEEEEDDYDDQEIDDET